MNRILQSDTQEPELAQTLWPLTGCVIEGQQKREIEQPDWIDADMTVLAIELGQPRRAQK